MIRPFGYMEFMFILEATRWTILLSLIAFVGGSIGGLIVALCRISASRFLSYPAAGFIRLIQGTPLLMQLFLIFFAAPVLGLSVEPLLAAAIGLSLNASAFLGEIWRGCIQSIPKGQWDASRALGLHYFKRMRYVILPQAIPIALPPTVGFLVQLIKATSLAAIIGFTELTRAGQIINNATFRPFLVFGMVAAIYFILCWPLSVLSERLERRYALAGK
jgi:polar amino acid transport system permease protein